MMSKKKLQKIKGSLKVSKLMRKHKQRRKVRGSKNYSKSFCNRENKAKQKIYNNSFIKETKVKGNAIAN